jgi:hypothetical protein
MKTVEELAREADLSSMSADRHCREDYWTATRDELSSFRDLVLEEAALMVYTATDNMHDERDMVLKEIIAEAIRAMKGQK